MSLERLKVKKAKYSDTYSKNAILNSLIKQKLQGQIQQIKESTLRVIQRNDEPTQQKQRSQLQSRRMKSLSTLTINRIRESLQFDPAPMGNAVSQEVASFLSNRQRESYIIEPEKLRSVMEARSKPKDLDIKMSARDRHQYEKLESRQKIQAAQRQVKYSIQGISDQLWIPQQPEVEELLKDENAQQEYMKRIDQDLKMLKQRSQQIHLSNASQKEIQTISPLLCKDEIQKDKAKTFSVLGFEGSLPEAAYNPKKYHKDDYINLQEFLKASLNSTVLTNMNPSEHLSKCYAIYMSTWKELIRLTYIESWQKGLLLERMLWSFIRLIGKVIECQRAVNYQQFKQQSQLLRETRAMFEDRMDKLELLVKQKQAQVTEMRRVESRMILSVVSFEKVNHQLGDDLEDKTHQLEQSRQELNYIQNKYHNLLNDLVENQMIYNDEKRYYIINKYHQPEMLLNLVSDGGGKLTGNTIYDDNSPSKNKRKFVDLPESTKLSMPSVVKEPSVQQHEYTRYGRKIKKLQNQLNKYWQKKSDDLQLKAVLEQLTNIRLKDMAVETDHRDKLFIDIGIQVGDDDEEDKFDFQTFLKEKISEERHFWQEKQDQSKNLYISLQELYDESYHRIQQLESDNSELRQEVQEFKLTNAELNEGITSQLAEKYTLQLNIKERVEGFQEQIALLDSTIQALQQQTSQFTEEKCELERKLKVEKENNQILVRRNVDGEAKRIKIEKERDGIINKIKCVAPWLQKFMEAVDGMEEGNLFTLFSQVSKEIEEHLRQYVEKDASLFSLTK